QAAEDALEQSERWFRALTEESGDTVAALDAAGNVQYASPTTPRLLGYSVSEFVGQNVLDLMHPDDRPRVMKLFGELLQTPGVTLSGEFRFKHANGTWQWLEGAGTNLLHDPSVRGVVSNYRDITARRQAQAAQSVLVER